MERKDDRDRDGWMASPDHGHESVEQELVKDRRPGMPNMGLKELYHCFTELN